MLGSSKSTTESKTMKVLYIIPAAVVVAALFAAFGWISNVIALCRLDFEAPYKAEVVRSIGVFFPPVGMVAGYMTFAEERK
jgi:hypothetical protein